MSNFDSRTKFQLEMNTYNLADQFASNYGGGVWNFNDEFGYWELDSDEVFDVYVESNGFQGKLDAKAFSLAIATLLHNHLSWHLHSVGRESEAQAWSDSFYKIRDHALNTLDRDNVSAYLGFID